MDHSGVQDVSEDDSYWLEFFIFVCCTIMFTLIFSFYAWFITAQVIFMDTLSLVALAITLGLTGFIAYTFYRILTRSKEEGSSDPTNNLERTEAQDENPPCIETRSLTEGVEASEAREDATGEIFELTDRRLPLTNSFSPVSTDATTANPVVKDPKYTRRMVPKKHHPFHRDANVSGNKRTKHDVDTNTSIQLENGLSREGEGKVLDSTINRPVAERAELNPKTRVSPVKRSSLRGKTSKKCKLYTQPLKRACSDPTNIRTSTSGSCWENYLKEATRKRASSNPETGENFRGVHTHESERTRRSGCMKRKIPLLEYPQRRNSETQTVSTEEISPETDSQYKNKKDTWV